MFITSKIGKKDIPICRIKGGKFDKKIIYMTLNDDRKKDNLPISFERLLAYDMGKKSLDEKAFITAKLSKYKQMLIKNTKPAKNDEIFNALKKKFDDMIGKDVYVSDGKLIPLPNDLERGCFYISGPSGCGKSTYCGFLIDGFLKMFGEDVPIKVFSRLYEDPALDKFNIERIELNEDFPDNIPDLHELKNSFLIFDDIDSIRNKKITEAIHKLIDDILQSGRKFNIWIAVTYHLCTNYKKTRIILNESHYITLFPRGCGKNQMKYLLKKYIGLNNDQIKEICDVKSRWITIRKSYPNLYIYEHGLKFLN